MQAPLYNKDGKEVSTLELKDEMFNLPWNADLVHQVVVAMQSNARNTVAHTKDRSEVSGSNQKPWRQKGTGRARHGQRISPIWRGGGIAFGPRNEQNFDKKVNKKMRNKALFIVLSQKLRDGEIVFVDDIATSEPKTKDALSVLRGLASVEGFTSLMTKKKNSALVVLPEQDDTTAKSFRNIGIVEVENIRNINPVQLLTYKYLVVAQPKEVLKVLESRSNARASVAPANS